jgi:2-polyprenyl-6-methoxyphenol hydroxylase-like FAD-dependent oxidoreductase
MALEDAVVLAACLEDAVAPAAAFMHFEPLRQERTCTVMKNARHKGARKRAGDPVAVFLRDLLLPVLISLGMEEARRTAAFRVGKAPLALPG